MTFRDLTSQRFGRLVVLERHPTDGGKVKWLCRCDCGIEKAVTGNNLSQGRTQSCGCLHNEQLAERRTSHGKSGGKVYSIWQHMRRRCSDPKNRYWKDYGGRGIQVCERWQSFENFYADMGDPPPSTSIDRIDNDGNYEPDNCRWATISVQSRNRRSNRLVEYKGETKTLTDWCEQFGLNREMVRKRLTDYKWSVERAFETPSQFENTGKVA